MKLRRLLSHALLLCLAGAAFTNCTVKERAFKKESSSGGGDGGGMPDGSMSDGGASGSSSGAGGKGGAGGTGGASGTDTGGNAGDAGTVCTPRAPVCDDAEDRATVCLGDGTGPAPGGTRCGTGQSCKDGECVDDPCMAGMDFCRLKEIRRCSADGQSDAPVKTCKANEFCDAKSVTCKPQQCTPKSHQCGPGEQPQVCPDDGSDWVDDGAACSDPEPRCVGEGVCTCVTGGVRCGGTGGKQPQICDDKQNWLNKGEPCSSVVYTGCLEGRCNTKTVPIPFGGGVWNRGTPAAPLNVTLSGNYRLDKYEVTVGQFRRFVNAVVDDGYMPKAGEGKHVLANSQNGLNNYGSAGGNEVGWDSNNNNHIYTDRALWEKWLVHVTDTQLAAYATWTNAVGPNENKPINMVNWYEAYAYCIWDGGYLPTEAEWEWAARGTNKGYTYPWGNDPPGNDTQKAIWGCFYPDGDGVCDDGPGNIANVDEGPAMAGATPEGLIHMAGNVWEWTMDWMSGAKAADPPIYPADCKDCANLLPTGLLKVDRGGDFYYDAAKLTVSNYRLYRVDYREHLGGLRCAHPGDH